VLTGREKWNQSQQQSPRGFLPAKGVIDREKNRQTTLTQVTSERVEAMRASSVLAHSRVVREFLANIGTIHSDGFIDVMLRRRRLGSVEENFIKQLKIGDLFVLGG
jgi:Lhr-like helicase